MTSVGSNDGKVRSYCQEGRLGRLGENSPGGVQSPLHDEPAHRYALFCCSLLNARLFFFAEQNQHSFIVTGFRPPSSRDARGHLALGSLHLLLLGWFVAWIIRTIRPVVNGRGCIPAITIFHCSRYDSALYLSRLPSPTRRCLSRRIAATFGFVLLLFVARSYGCTGDELGRSEAQLPGCLGYESDLFLGGVYPNANHEPPPELWLPLSPNSRCRRTLGWRRRLARHLEGWNPELLEKFPANFSRN